MIVKLADTVSSQGEDKGQVTTHVSHTEELSPDTFHSEDVSP
jgi:hypothetical protein